jgi:hypothetical protein
LLESRLGAALALEFGEQLAVADDEDAGTVDDESDLVIAVAFADEKDHAGEGGEVVFNRTQAVVKPMSYLVRFFTLKEQPHRLDTMSLARSDVLLLTAGRHLHAGAA